MSGASTPPLPPKEEKSTPPTPPSPPSPSLVSGNTPISPSGSNQTDKRCLNIASRDQFNQLLTDIEHKPLLLEFFAVWCGACMLISSKLEELAQTYYGKLIIARVNVDDLEELALEYGVSMMPAFVLIKEKKVMEQFAGNNQEKLESIIKKYCGEHPSTGEAAHQSVSV